VSCPLKKATKKWEKYRAYSRSKVDVATDRKEYFHDYYIEMCFDKKKYTVCFD